MFIVEFLKELLKGRGIFPSFLVISSWSFTFVLICIFLYNLFLYFFQVKYESKRFTDGLAQKDNNKNKR
ncbi:MAG: hypothetical protein AB6733_17905 [Clostridiaceae bacterium]